MATFQQICNSARVVLNDVVFDDSTLTRYTETQLLEYARAALVDARRVRPDLFLSRLTGAFPAYAASAEIPISEDYVMPLVDYVIHRCELRDDEFAVDGRAAALYQKFKSGMLGV
ncbi:MAG: hypothetical protein HQ446_06250 [Polaromonas sp.]|nr:hypothetical protein [Polaromonas sp.]